MQQHSFRAAMRLLPIAILSASPATCDEARAQFVYGIDVSTYQGSVNWTSVKNGGIRFAFCKATEGVDYVDSQFRANMSNAGAAGVYIGPYHYGRPDSFEDDPLDATNEANDFVDAIERYYRTPGFTLRPVVDMEESDLTGVADKKAFLSEWLRNFNDVVETRLGFPAVVYASTSYINSYFEPSIRQYDLWLANWNYAPPDVPPSSADGIFNGWAFWQYTSSGNVGGLSPVDRDVFHGTMADMLSEFRGVAPSADFDADNDVDGADLLVWQRNIGRTGTAATFARGNADGDLAINAADIGVWQAQFGGAMASAVPEPSTAAGLAIAGAMIGLLRRAAPPGVSCKVCRHARS